MRPILKCYFFEIVNVLLSLNSIFIACGNIASFKKLRKLVLLKTKPIIVKSGAANDFL